MIEISTNELPPVLNPEYVAKLLECEPGTVEEGCRRGDIPGIKFGVGWVIPTGALLTVLNNVALAKANERQQPPPQKATVLTIGGKRRPPELPDGVTP